VVGSRLLFGLPTHLYFHRISRSLFLLDQEWEESSHVIIFLYLIIKKKGHISSQHGSHQAGLLASLTL
jgi:hypothetical protein